MGLGIAAIIGLSIAAVLNVNEGRLVYIGLAAFIGIFVFMGFLDYLHQKNHNGGVFGTADRDFPLDP